MWNLLFLTTRYYVFFLFLFTATLTFSFSTRRRSRNEVEGAFPHGTPGAMEAPAARKGPGDHNRLQGAVEEEDPALLQPQRGECHVFQS